MKQSIQPFSPYFILRLANFKKRMFENIQFHQPGSSQFHLTSVTHSSQSCESLKEIRVNSNQSKQILWAFKCLKGFNDLARRCMAAQVTPTIEQIKRIRLWYVPHLHVGIIFSNTVIKVTPNETATLIKINYVGEPCWFSNPDEIYPMTCQLFQIFFVSIQSERVSCQSSIDKQKPQ